MSNWRRLGHRRRCRRLNWRRCYRNRSRFRLSHRRRLRSRGSRSGCRRRCYSYGRGSRSRRSRTRWNNPAFAVEFNLAEHFQARRFGCFNHGSRRRWCRGRSCYRRGCWLRHGYRGRLRCSSYRSRHCGLGHGSRSRRLRGRSGCGRLGCSSLSLGVQLALAARLGVALRFLLVLGRGGKFFF